MTISPDDNQGIARVECQPSVNAFHFVFFLFSCYLFGCFINFLIIDQYDIKYNGKSYRNLLINKNIEKRLI